MLNDTCLIQCSAGNYNDATENFLALLLVFAYYLPTNSNETYR